jgi:peptidoglycan/LPS O-acetylase OafA/YrhL
MQYRREVDGLRAVAIVIVIFYHCELDAISGGFIGVDIFFVISGYLITTIIIRDINKHQFSILNFYERRIRRICPALFITIILTIPFSWRWLLDTTFEQFSQSILAVCLFVSNMKFWTETGYFNDNTMKPLLHTWSLAVEEQFYIVFPPFLRYIYTHHRNHVFKILVFLFLVSLLSAEYAHYTMQRDAAFYMLPFRAWELLVGCILAVVEVDVKRHEIVANQKARAGGIINTAHASDICLLSHT